jgi:hypothetical protein
MVLLLFQVTVAVFAAELRKSAIKRKEERV